MKLLIRRSVWACSLLSTYAFAGNMLQNPSFEAEVPGSPRDALHWKFGEPDFQGDIFGSAAREDWRSHDGMFIMTVRGKWADKGEYGGAWQTAKAEPGETYRAAAWFWADSEWHPSLQELKLEFYTENYGELLLTESTPLGELEARWQRREVTATAPEDTHWVRLVINVQGVSDAGALQFDSVYLSPLDRFNEPEPDPLDVIIDILED
jgi:hypothetical protein